MRSTGEVMGVAETFPEAFHKAMLSVNAILPDAGKVFVSVRDDDKQAACELGLRLSQLGYTIVATSGTRRALARVGVDAELVYKVGEGRPHVVDRIRDGEIVMVVNTTEGAETIRDSRSLRRQTILAGVPYFTTIAAAIAAVEAIVVKRKKPLTVKPLQEYHRSS